MTRTEGCQASCSQQEPILLVFLSLLSTTSTTRCDCIGNPSPVGIASVTPEPGSLSQMASYFQRLGDADDSVKRRARTKKSATLPVFPLIGSEVDRFIRTNGFGSTAYSSSDMPAANAVGVHLVLSPYKYAYPHTRRAQDQQISSVACGPNAGRCWQLAILI